MEIIEILSQLVEIKSTDENKDEITKCVELVGNYFQLHSAPISYIEKSGIKHLIAGNKKADILFIAHADVVAAGSGWTKDPWSTTIEGDRVYGRGTNDMKGSIAAFISALPELNPDNYCFILTGDEEKSSVAARAFAKMLNPKMAIALEPTNFDIVNKCKGYLFFKNIQIDGKTSHGSRPWNGINAISRATDFIKSLEQLNKENTTITPTIIHGGLAGNQVPDKVELCLDVRFLEEDYNSIIENIESRLKNIGSLGQYHFGPPNLTPNSSPLVRNLFKICHSVLEKRPVIRLTEGSSDAVFFAANGSHTVEFGPVGNNIHTADEWVSLQSLKQLKEIIITFTKTKIL